MSDFSGTEVFGCCTLTFSGDPLGKNRQLCQALERASEEVRGESLSVFSEVTFTDPNFTNSVQATWQVALTAYQGVCSVRGERWPVTIYFETKVGETDGQYVLTVVILGIASARDLASLMIYELYDLCVDGTVI